MLSSYRDLKTIGQVMEEAQEKPAVQETKIERRKKENVSLIDKEDEDILGLEEKSIATWRKASFGFGNFSRYTVLGIQAYFLNPFLLEVAGISAFWAGTIQLIKQLYDGITDPMVGRLSDRVETRWGRRKPWIIAATVPSGILWILQWLSPDFITGSEDLAVLYYTLVLLAFSTANTFVSVPYNAMVPDITKNYHDRTSVVMFQEVFGLLSIILFSFVQAKIVEYFPDENDPLIVDYKKGYFVSSLITVWAVVIPILISIMFVSEKKRVQTEDEEDTTGKQIFVRIGLWFWYFIKSLLKALLFKEFTLLVITFVCSMLAVYMVVNNFVLYAKYVLNVEHQTAYLMLILQGSVTLSFFFWALLSRLLGKRLTFFIGSVIWVGGSIIVFFIDEDHVPLFYGITCLRAWGSGVGYLIPLSILPDLIEIDRVKNSQQREGILYSLMILLQKTGVGVGLMFSNYLLQFAGFESPSDQTQAQQEANYQPDSVLLALRFLNSFVPVVFIVIANISLLFIPQ